MMTFVRWFAVLACAGAIQGVERPIFFCEYQERFSARVTKSDDGAEALELSDGVHGQRVPFEAGQQFFLTAEFRDLDGDGRPELIVYVESGTGLESMLYKVDRGGAWHGAFAYRAKARVTFFNSTPERIAAICPQEDGTVRRWRYLAAADGSWSITPDAAGDK